MAQWNPNLVGARGVHPVLSVDVGFGSGRLLSE